MQQKTEKKPYHIFLSSASEDDEWRQRLMIYFRLLARRNVTGNLVAFLDEMTRRLLLYKAGGSYLFVHRLLLEYFASLETPLPIEKKTTDLPDFVESTIPNKSE
ncbi:MAG TPA: hypothetical protein VGN34_16090 [Ktedonobacteraceae bacterium]|jgi:hypothetical protein